MPNVQLRILKGADAGRVFDLEGTLVVGRDPSAADVVLEDEQISRRHLGLTVRGESALVVDLWSANGTFVNDELVVGEQRLDQGDRITLGTTVLEVVGEAEPAAPANPTPSGRAARPASARCRGRSRTASSR